MKVKGSIVARDIHPRTPDDYDNEIEGKPADDDDESCELVVTQAELLAYRRLSRMLKKKSVMRLQILKKLEEGATIQQGKYWVKRKVVETQNLSWHRVQQYLGDSLVEVLRDVVPITTQTQLMVHKAKSGH